MIVIFGIVRPFFSENYLIQDAPIHMGHLVDGFPLCFEPLQQDPHVRTFDKKEVTCPACLGDMRTEF